MPADDVADRKPRSSGPFAPAATSAVANGSAIRPSVFTTVEEDLARQQHQQARSWLSVIGPLLSLALALAALAGLGLYISRPSTADELYEQISRSADAEDADSMRAVEREINDFVARFPNDERAPQLRTNLLRLELDRMHRQFQRRRRSLTDPSLLPVEVLYLESMNTAPTSPETAIRMLESLVKLYGTSEPADKSDERRLMCVQLAERQLVQLREDIARLATRQLAAIHERLAAADALAHQHPDEARGMYQAILDLYGDRPWAEAVVADARKKLNELAVAK
jgi:hypothetical protein